MRVLTGDFGELVIETEMIDVSTSLPVPTETWRYTDRNGHEHYWDKGYPTLVSEPFGEPYAEDYGDELYQPTRLVCAICREPIVPDTHIESYRKYVPGRTSATLNGEPISKERYEEIVAQIRAQGS